MHKHIDVDSPALREMMQSQKDAAKETDEKPEHGVNCNIVKMR